MIGSIFGSEFVAMQHASAAEQLQAQQHALVVERLRAKRPWGPGNIVVGCRFYGSPAEYEAERARLAAMPRIVRKGGSVPEVRR